MRFPSAAVILALLVLSGELRAQSAETDSARDAAPAQMSDVRSGRLGWIAALESILASPDVSALESALNQARALRHGRAWRTVIGALAAQRRYELTGEEEHHRSARESLEELRDPSTDSPVIDFVLGHILLHGPESGLARVGWYPSRPVFSASNMEYEARRLLIDAIDVEPSLAPAALDLAALAIASRRMDPLEEARDALGTAIGAGAADARVHVAASQVYLTLGEEEQALASARAALRLEPANPSAHYALAKALWRAGGQEEAAAEAYFAGAERMGTTGEPAAEIAAVQYFQDLLPILNEAEEREWSSLAPDERAAWLREFWAVEAALNGRTVAERLAHHYRRLRTAHTMYRRRSGRGAAPPGKVRPAEDPRIPFDDRGIIFVRQGQPLHVVRTPPRDVSDPQNETWAYPGPNRLVSYTFLRIPKYPDYHLMQSVFTCSDVGRLRQVGFGWRFNTDRGHLGYPFNVMSTKCMSGADRNPREIMQVRADLRATAVRGLSTRTDLPRTDTPLPFALQLYTFRGDGPRGVDGTAAGPGTAVEAGLLIAAAPLKPQQYRGDLLYAADVSVMVIDTMTGVVERRDTLIRAVSESPLGQDQYLRLEIGMEAPPTSSAAYRVLVRDASAPSTGTMLGGDTRIPAYGPDLLQLSDLVLSDLSAGGNPRARPPLLASHTFDAEQPIHLYYEIYNLPPLARYRVRIRIQPLEDDGLWDQIKGLFGSEDGIELSFEQTAPDEATAVVPQRRRITTDLPPGLYELIIQVEDQATGQRVTRTTRLTIRE